MVLKLDDFGFSPRVDILMGLVKHLGKNESRRQVQVQDFSEGKKTIGKNWITQFLDRHPIISTKIASHIYRHRAYASNPRIINDHFAKLGKVLCTGRFTPKAIANVDEKGFIMGVAPKTRVTRRGKKNIRVKQDGKREFITALEAVSADGFPFPS